MTGSGGKVGEGFKVRTEFYRVFIYFNAINCCRWRVSPVAECGTPRASASGRPTPGGALTCRPVLSFFFSFSFFFAEEAQKQKQKKKGKSFPSFSFFLFNGPATAGDRSVHGRASHWPDALARPRRSSFVSVAVVVVVVVVGVCVCVCGPCSVYGDVIMA